MVHQKLLILFICLFTYFCESLSIMPICQRKKPRCYITQWSQHLEYHSLIESQIILWANMPAPNLATWVQSLRKHIRGELSPECCSLTSTYMYVFLSVCVYTSTQLNNVHRKELDQFQKKLKLLVAQTLKTSGDFLSSEKSHTHQVFW